jgi:peptide subunit release factor 1 (eRF1)
MAKSSPGLDSPLRAQLEKLAAYEPRDVPVVSLYLNLASDQHGRDNYDAFVRKAFADHVKAFKETSAERASLERDMERINKYLAEEVNRSSNGLALFASSGGAEFFEAIQLDAALDDHWFFIGSVPHLYPLAMVIDQYPRYASVLLDTNRARIFVFSLGSVERREQLTTEKTKRHSMGGWSQARYQRRAENVHQQHVKDVVDALDKVVQQDRIEHIIVAGDDVVVALLREHLPKHLDEKIVDVLSLQRDAAEDEIITATLEVLRHKDAETDAERVQELIGEWQSGGLGVVGPDAALKALQMGQVDELLVTGRPDALRATRLPDNGAPGQVKAETSAVSTADERQLKLADELVTRAQQTNAHVRFIEDPQLLADFGGVAALLRFRI